MSKATTWDDIYYVKGYFEWEATDSLPATTYLPQDQVMPLPYTVGSAQLDDEAWISTMSGLDGTSDSAATIRRHSTLRAGNDFTSTRLVGRSVWNDKWLIVIPASSLNADRTRALETFINGVGDIKLGIKAYSRSGN